MRRERVVWPADRAARSGPTSQPSAGQPTVTLLVSGAEAISAEVERDIKDNMKKAKLNQQKARVTLWTTATRCYAQFSELRDDLHDDVLWAKAHGMELLGTTIEGFDISVTDWTEEYPKHDYKDMVAWRMTSPSKGETALLERWVEDMTQLLDKTRDTKSRQDKFFAQLYGSLFGKTNVDSPESILSSLKTARALMETIANQCVDPTDTLKSAGSVDRQISGDAGSSKAANGEGVDLEALVASLGISNDAGSTWEDLGEAGALMDEWESRAGADDSDGETDGGDEKGGAW